MFDWYAIACRLGAIGFVALAFVAHAEPAAPPPVAAFFDPAKLQGAALSPSGRWLASMTNAPGRRVGFLIVDLEGKEGSHYIEPSTKDDVVWFSWVNEDWLVFRVFDPEDRNPYGLGSGLMSTRRDGAQSRMLIGRNWAPTDLVHKRRELPPDHYFLHLGAPGTNEVIVGERHEDVNYEYSHTTLKAIDVATGEVRTVQPDAPKSNLWWFDAKGRARVSSYEQGGTVTLHWADKTGTWREIAKAPRYKLPFWPAYIEDDESLVVTTPDASGFDEVRRFDFTTGKVGATASMTTPGFDGGPWVYRDSLSGKLQALRLDLDAETTVWLSPAMQKIQDEADSKFPGHVNRLSCVRCDNPKVVLIYSYSATDPGSYVLYRPQEGRWQLIGQARPDIDAGRMAPLSFHRIKARDGADLPVWVTRPRQAGAQAKPGPTVVLVHGGPFLRDTFWQWDAQAQFLASRGYTVVQPEFRGTTGYGLAHSRAGWKQWGGAMLDDITDALHFAVAQGWSDASRVCIMGASYGGYATLMGLAKSPDQYRCGVALAAVSDLRFMYEFHWNDLSRAGKTYELPVVLGDLKTDAAMLEATSPLVQVARIKAPLLLAHGSADRRVPVQNGERMHDALRKAGKDVEWVLYEDEGHGFTVPKNELDYWSRVEAFLAKHLKP